MYILGLQEKEAAKLRVQIETVKRQITEIEANLQVGIAVDIQRPFDQRPFDHRPIIDVGLTFART